ncbi:MAG: V-type ATP synthase subunit D, partial [Clostridia bacterium]
ILVREMMGLLDKAKKIQREINSTFSAAYEALQKSNMSSGMNANPALIIPIEDGIDLKFRSVMGVEIPIVILDEIDISIPFGLFPTNSMLDEAYVSFVKVKYLTAILAETENSIYRLALAIKKTQKRANALQNIIIPKYEQTIKYITEVLEEREREEFSRLKVIKKQHQE